jgi:hypothetical protein
VIVPSRPTVARLFLLTLTSFLLWGQARAADLVTWEGTYAVNLAIGDGTPSRVGTETRRYFPADFEGQRVQAFESISQIALKLQGMEVSMSTTTLSYSNSDRDPLYMESTSVAGAGKQILRARYAPDRVTYERVLNDGEPTKGEVLISEGITLRDLDLVWDPATANVGAPVTAWGFNPVSLSLTKTTLTALGEEQITLGGETVKAFRIDADEEITGLSSLWVDEGGMVYRMTTSLQGMSFTSERVTGEAPTGPPDTVPGPPPDVMLGSFVDCGAVIPDARACREMRIVVSGIDRERLFLPGVRQSYGPIESYGPGLFRSELTVKTEELPTSGQTIGTEVPDDVRPYLLPTATIQADDAKILETARTIVGDETDAWAAAQKIGEWVTANVTPSLSEGLLRSAREVLDNPRGECRSYSALYCGLARAAGIPCRVVAGAVYVGGMLGPESDRKFGFHAWDEVWVGRWVAIDTAFQGPQGFCPVDATHLKFAEGDIADLTSAARVVRGLELQLLDADTQHEQEKPLTWLPWVVFGFDREVQPCAQAS